MNSEKDIIDVLKSLYKKGLTTSSGGNISIVDKQGSMWITPAAIDKGSLTVNDLVKINKDGKIKGKHRPSSEFPLHRSIYESCPEIKAILHAHPPYIVGYCITNEKLNTKIQPDIYNMCGEIGFVSYSCPGSKELAKDVAAEFKKGYSIIMLENHGVVVGGRSLKEAYYKIIILNICADVSIQAKKIGKLNILDLKQLKLAETPISYLKKHLLKPLSDDDNCSKPLLLTTKRAYKQNLLIGNLGSISIRKKNNSFIISKEFIDWEKVRYADFESLYKKEKTYHQFTRGLFKKIYERHPNINCIIHSYAPSCFAFSLTDTLIDIKTVPESVIILKGLVYAAYESFYNNIDLICNSINENTPLVLMKNNGILVMGTSLFQAFDRLEVAENTAKSIIVSNSIGKINSLGQEEIDAISLKYTDK